MVGYDQILSVPVSDSSTWTMAHDTSSGAKCDAKLVRISMIEKSRIHKKRADIPTTDGEYENCSEKTYIQAVGFDCLLRPIQSKTLNVNQAVEVEN